MLTNALFCFGFFKTVVLLFSIIQKPEEGSISQRVQRLAKYRFLKVISPSLL